MKRLSYGKWLSLAILILVAGCLYSCGEKGRGEWLPGLQAEEQENEAESEAGSPEAGKAPDTHEPAELHKAGDGAVFMKDTAASCFVHVCGEVEKPGVYELEEGRRVYEAVAMAGGFTERAAQDYLNLAEPIWDGMKLEVPDREQVPPAEWPVSEKQPGTAKSAGPSSGKVNLNTATKEELMTLRGIGEAKAEDILRYRQKQGGFERIEDIMEISGIKNAAFEKIKDDITV